MGRVDDGGRSDVSGDPLEPCKDALIPAMEWFTQEPGEPLEGLLEFGQTHVVRAQEERIAPPVTAERETLMLFAPGTPIEPAADVRVAAVDGETVLGVLRLASPDLIPSALEQGLTGVTLDPYTIPTATATGAQRCPGIGSETV